jgi:hypothetical protein
MGPSVLSCLVYVHGDYDIYRSGSLGSYREIGVLTELNGSVYVFGRLLRA